MVRVYKNEAGFVLLFSKKLVIETDCFLEFRYSLPVSRYSPTNISIHIQQRATAYTAQIHILTHC